MFMRSVRAFTIRNAISLKNLDRVLSIKKINAPLLGQTGQLPVASALDRLPERDVQQRIPQIMVEHGQELTMPIVPPPGQHSHRIGRNDPAPFLAKLQQHNRRLVRPVDGGKVPFALEPGMYLAILPSTQQNLLLRVPGQHRRLGRQMHRVGHVPKGDTLKQTQISCKKNLKIQK